MNRSDLYFGADVKTSIYCVFINFNSIYWESKSLSHFKWVWSERLSGLINTSLIKTIPWALGLAMGRQTIATSINVFTNPPFIFGITSFRQDKIFSRTPSNAHSQPTLPYGIFRQLESYYYPSFSSVNERHTPNPPPMDPGSTRIISFYSEKNIDSRTLWNLAFKTNRDSSPWRISRKSSNKAN